MEEGTATTEREQDMVNRDLKVSLCSSILPTRTLNQVTPSPGGAVAPEN